MTLAESFTLVGDLYEYEKFDHPIFQTKLGAFHLRNGNFSGRVQPFQLPALAEGSIVEENFEYDGYQTETVLYMPQETVDSFRYGESYVIDGERVVTIGSRIPMITGVLGTESDNEHGMRKSAVEVYEAALPEPREETEEFVPDSVLPEETVDSIFKQKPVERVCVV